MRRETILSIVKTFPETKTGFWLSNGSSTIEIKEGSLVVYKFPVTRFWWYFANSKILHYDWLNEQFVCQDFSGEIKIVKFAKDDLAKIFERLFLLSQTNIDDFFIPIDGKLTRVGGIRRQWIDNIMCQMSYNTTGYKSTAHEFLNLFFDSDVQCWNTLEFVNTGKLNKKDIFRMLVCPKGLS